MDLVEGVQVYVEENTRRSTRRFTTEITRVGRKYFYIAPYGHEVKICKQKRRDSTGYGAGWQYAVYESEQEHLELIEAKKAWDKLVKRLSCDYTNSKNIPPCDVDKVLSLLK